MSLYMKHIKRLVQLGFIGCLLISINGKALACGEFQLQSNRSSGVSVKSNECTDPSNISKGTVFDLSAKGRLWLKSNASENTSYEFQMICQNRTLQTVQLEFSDPLLPWLNVAKLNNCSGWLDNKLICDGNNGEKKGIYCALAFIKQVPRNKLVQIERTSSVKMRDVSQLFAEDKHYDSFDKQQLVETLVSELKLCKKLNDISQDISINWIVQMANVKTFKILTPGVKNDDYFSGCIEGVITTTSYPRFSKEVSFDSVF